MLGSVNEPASRSVVSGLPASSPASTGVAVATVLSGAIAFGAAAVVVVALDADVVVAGLVVAGVVVTGVVITGVVIGVARDPSFEAVVCAGGRSTVSGLAVAE